MNANLLSLVQGALGGDNFSKLAAPFLGETQGATQSAISALLPAVLGGLVQKGATPQGAASLMSLINGANLDTASLGNLAGLFGGGGAGVNAMLKAGTNNLVPALFGDKSSGIVNALSSMSGLKNSSATNLLAMVVPLILAFLKKFIGEKGLSASSLATLLADQAPNLRGALSGPMAGALGLSSPSALLSGLAGQAAGAAERAGAVVAGGAAAATAATRSGLSRWLPWLIGLAVILLLWYLMSGKPTPPAPTSAPAPAAAPAAPVAMAGLPAKIYFDVGAATVGPEGSAQIAKVAELVKKDNVKVNLTGYTDRTGDAAANETLAKNRVTAVKAALTAAGVAESSIELKPPMFVEIGASGPDAEARRVEISKQ